MNDNPLRFPTKKESSDSEDRGWSERTNRPTIVLMGGETGPIVDQILAAVRSMPDDLYQQSGRIVRPIWETIKTTKGLGRTLRLQVVGVPGLRDVVSKAARFGKPTGEGVKIVDCPENILESYLARGDWGLRPLLGITSSPSLRPDCESACKKDPVIGVIGIQTGPRDRWSTVASMFCGSRGLDVGRGDNRKD